MTTIQQLRKINSKAVQETKDAKTYEENIVIFSKYNREVEKYRNALLAVRDGDIVQFKGYLTAEHKENNYTLTCVQIIYKGYPIDTLHHLNLYADLITNQSIVISSKSIQGEGNYSFDQIDQALDSCMCNGQAPSQSLVVEGEGIVYKYGNGKYSIGTSRQVDYATK